MKIPILLFILVAPFTPFIDLTLAQYFHDHPSSNPLYNFLYTYGVYPANIIASIGGLVFIFSFIFKKLKPYRSKGLYLALVLAIGAGLVINGVFKEFWGRPRPRQVIQFGGTQEYRPFWKPNFHPLEPSKGFPCGHCAMAFYFFSLAFLLPRKKYVIAFALLFGALMGWTRMAQEGHFFSDVLASALIMWLIAEIFSPPRTQRGSLTYK